VDVIQGIYVTQLLGTGNILSGIGRAAGSRKFASGMLRALFQHKLSKIIIYRFCHQAVKRYRPQ